MMVRVTPFLLAAVLAFPAAAQTVDPGQLPLAELQAQLAAGKQILVARSLAMTPAEEADFWPVFDELQRGLAELERRRGQARSSIGGGGRGAATGAETLVEADLDQAELFERAWDRLRGALPPEKLARYLDLERRIAASRFF